jgi:hypothetical protein
VKEDRDWIVTYKRIMSARNTIEGATGMRKTKTDHILIEFEKKFVVSEVAALVSTIKEELVEDMRREC